MKEVAIVFLSQLYKPLIPNKPNDFLLRIFFRGFTDSLLNKKKWFQSLADFLTLKKSAVPNISVIKRIFYIANIRKSLMPI